MILILYQIIMDYTEVDILQHPLKTGTLLMEALIPR